MDSRPLSSGFNQVTFACTFVRLAPMSNGKNDRKIVKTSIRKDCLIN